MRNKCLLILLAFSANMFAWNPQARAVVIDTVCNAPWQTMLRTAEKFCYQFQACPDSLSSWAYRGIDDPTPPDHPKTKESRDAIQLCYKDRTYDPKTKTGDVAIDIYVLGARWWKDKHLGTKYVLSRNAASKFPLTARMTATYSGSILQGGKCIFRLEPINDHQTSVHYEFEMVFGKVLSAFISDKTWHNAIEWRLRATFENLIEYTETGTVSPKHHGPKP